MTRNRANLLTQNRENKEALMDTHIPHLDVGSGRHLGALTLFPLWSDARHLGGLSWNNRCLHVQEADGGSVPRLAVHNRASKATVLIEGDVLVGGLQHRMAASTRLIPAGASESVDVLCVEQGRWGGEREHRLDGHRAAPSVRHANVGRGAPERQGEVWRRIARYDRELGASGTSSMLDHLDHDVNEREAVERMLPMPGQRGVVVGIGGQVIGAELFGSSRALTDRWQGLVRGAWLDARLAPAARTTSHDARSFVRGLGRLRLEVQEQRTGVRAVTAKRDSLRISGVSRIEPDGTPVPLHLMAFDESHFLLEYA